MEQKQKCSKELYCNFLLAAQVNFTTTEMAEHLENISHDAVTRWLAKTKLPPSLIWQQAESLIDKNSGYLILDDSVIDKSRSPKLPLAGWQYSGNSHKVVRGLGLITLLWSEHDEHIPLDFRIYSKKQDGFTKNQHFQEMLRLANHRGLKPKAVLFDTWYSSRLNLNTIQSFGWYWITQLRKNRVINKTQHLEELNIPDEGLIVDLKFVGPVKVFKFSVKNNDIEYIATNNLDLSSSDARISGAQRWKIEEYHRGLKQTVGVERCQARIPRSQRTHIFCSIMTFLALEKHRIKTGETWYKTKKDIISDAITSYLRTPTLELAFVKSA